MTDCKNRPRHTDPEILLEVARELFPELVSWGAEDEDREAFSDMLINEIDLDGYSLAKCCDDDLRWDPDARLVEILDRADIIARKIAKRRVANWVKENNICAEFAVGDHVKWQHCGSIHLTGKIVRIDSEKATYTIQDDGRDYAPPNGSKNTHPCGWIVNFEKVTGKAD